MADFCKQCSIKIFGEDFKDMAGIAPKGMFATVLCEECGPIQVDSDGNCVSDDCWENGHKAE